MEVSFWLATFDVGYPPAVAAAGVRAPAAPVASQEGKSTVAIEVRRAGAEYVVMLSTVDDKEQPRSLTCYIGFSNAAQRCDELRERGFPIIEARITLDGEALTIVTPYFAESDPEVMRYEETLLAISGVEFRRDDKSSAQLETTYHQEAWAPGAARPDTEITKITVPWTDVRDHVHVEQKPPPIKLDLERARLPVLAPLQEQVVAGAKIWSGLLGDATEQPAAARAPGRRAPTLEVEARPNAFTAYRFEDVEVLGFRIDLREFGKRADDVLNALVDPLNFHRTAGGGAAQRPSTARMADFQYRAAARAVVIEMLRYGRMKPGRPSTPSQVEGYQSQHELLVRVLVGRLDDDTTQAHDPAVFVPAIFVDNPWSKFVGRELQGFDKVLTSFWVSHAGMPLPLRPDGRFRDKHEDEERKPLGAVSQVRLVAQVGADTGDLILDLDCPPERYDNWDAFQAIDLRLALGSSVLAGARWRQIDFDAVEFRRSFAQPVISDFLAGFRSVQVSPVDDRGLEKTWISSRFELEDVRVAFPAGVATLTLRAPEAAPAAWNRLCALLGDDGVAEINLPTGDWYRLKCSMDLTIEDGLSW